MKVALMAYGTRGDSQPFLCLGRALADRGHEVEIVGDQSAASLTRSAGLSFTPLPCDMLQMFRSESAQRMLAAGKVSAALRWLAQEEKHYEDELHRALLGATESAELIVCTHSLEPRCRAIATARGIAIMPIFLFPLAPSRTFPSAFFSQRDLGPLNQISHELLFQMGWRAQRSGLTALHRELGLAPPTRRQWQRGYRGQAPLLLGYSPTLFPAPGDWPERLHTVGFLTPSTELRARFGQAGVSAELDAWLGAGQPPVFLGFGSMPVLDAGAMLVTIRDALANVGARGILAAGWSELSSASDDTLFIASGEVDHQSLLPRCAAAVHHGGAGTVAASVGAGTPTLICSVFFDQPFWGARCRDLGIGDTFPFAKLDSRRLTESLCRVLEPQVAARAKRIGQQMAEENGVEAAVAFAEQGVEDLQPVSG